MILCGMAGRGNDHILISYGDARAPIPLGLTQTWVPQLAGDVPSIGGLGMVEVEGQVVAVSGRRLRLDYPAPRAA